MAQLGGSIGLFANLVAAPTASLANVVFTSRAATSYPGMGGRNIADDGHRVTVELSSAPLP